ncbi:MAG TPA: tetratricopeptide repeat protein [Vicinamibacteria bacterium]
MRDPIPRGPFDQGLFLAHFNKGRDFYEAQRYEDAEHQLEEAYLLRPRDQKVLNLLGLVYFRQEKFEKAEEVYRKLVADSPDAHTLHYNLGLIHFKLNRLEDAESSFLKALELTKDNPKINFYLGSIYERLQRFKDAIYQYRAAGANIMVRRIEDRMAATVPPVRPAPAAPAAKKDDTAEFKASAVRDAIRQRVEDDGALLSPPKSILPVSAALLAEGAPSAPGPAIDGTLPPGSAQRLARSGPVSGPADRTLPASAPPPPEPFRFLENNLLEIDFSGKIFIKQGTIYSYSGNLTFWVKEKRPGSQATLVIITGTGRVLLTDKDREITLMRISGEAIHVEPAHLLACEEGVTPEYVRIGDKPNDLDFLALKGDGMVALSVTSKPLPLTVTPALPVSLPAASVISWSGNLIARVVQDRQIYEMMHVAEGTGRVLRLEGDGRVLVEQA